MPLVYKSVPTIVKWTEHPLRFNLTVVSQLKF
jgi:hypothetical protein